MSRVTTTQLKSLLANLEKAAATDHPLSEMYREFIKDVMLDLRDSLGEIAILQWYVRNMDREVKYLRDYVLKNMLDLKKLTPKQIEYVLEDILSHVTHADEHPNRTQVTSDAIAPMTGKEK